MGWDWGLVFELRSSKRKAYTAPQNVGHCAIDERILNLRHQHWFSSWWAGGDDWAQNKKSTTIEATTYIVGIDAFEDAISIPEWENIHAAPCLLEVCTICSRKEENCCNVTSWPKTPSNTRLAGPKATKKKRVREGREKRGKRMTHCHGQRSLEYSGRRSAAGGLGKLEYKRWILHMFHRKRRKHPSLNPTS